LSTYDSVMSRERLRQGGTTVAVGVALGVLCGAASAVDAWRGLQYGVLVGMAVVLAGLYVMVAPPSRRKRRQRWQAGDGPMPPDRPTGRG
jgi:Flp pilus assembly protein TadB